MVHRRLDAHDSTDKTNTSHDDLSYVTFYKTERIVVTEIINEDSFR